MGKLWVEVCLISARGLRPSSLFKLQWFAVGWIDPANKYCTGIDMSGTADPVWKTRFTTGVDVSDSGLQDLAIQVEVYSREPIFLRESLQGKVTIVLRELLDRYCNGKSGFSSPVEESGSFQLRRNGSGKNVGFVDVSIRISAEREEPGSSNRGDGQGFGLVGRKDGLSEKSPGRVHRPVVPSRDRESNQPGKIILTNRRAVESLSEDPGSNQPRKFVMTPQEAVETLSEDPGSNRPPNIRLISRQAVGTLPEGPGRNQPPKISRIPRQAVETQLPPEDPGSNRQQNFDLNSSQAPGSHQPGNFNLLSRRGVENWSEVPGINQATEIRPDSRKDSEARYHQPPQNLTWTSPSNVGYTQAKIFPRMPEFSAEALAAGAFIFGDDFLLGFDLHGRRGSGNASVNVSTAYCTKFHENTFQD